MKSTLQVLAIVATIVALSNGTKIQNCDDADAPSAATLTVQIGDCDEGRCVLERGKTYDFMVKFKASKDENDVKTIAKGKAYGLNRTLKSGVDDDACDNIKKRGRGNKKGEACPLKKETHYIYEKQITIREKELTIEADVQWYLYSGEDTLYCFKVPVKIV